MLCKRFTFFLFVAVVLITVGCRGSSEQKESEDKDISYRREAVMIKVVPNSSSVVRRATHILLVSVENSQFGEWARSPAGGVQRSVHLALRLEEVLKGETLERPGELLDTQVSQFGTGTTRIAALPGPWSSQILEPGVRLVVFCVHDGERAAEMLNAPSCEKVVPAADALGDVRLVLKSEAKDLSIESLLAEAELLASSLNQVFAEYLSERLSLQVLEDKAVFELVLRFVENPDLSYIVRAILVDIVNANVAAYDTPPVWQVNRLAVGLFRLLGISAASNLHDNIIEGILPDLLGLTGSGTVRRKADDVFHDYPGDRQKAIQLLRSYRGQASIITLLKWLGSD